MAVGDTRMVFETRKRCSQPFGRVCVGYRGFEIRKMSSCENGRLSLPLNSRVPSQGTGTTPRRPASEKLSKAPSDKAETTRDG